MEASPRRLPFPRLLLAFASILLAAPASAGELEVSIEGGPTVRMVEQVRVFGAERPGALGELRARVRALVGAGASHAEADATVREWLEENAPEIARVRAMGEPGASEEQIMESLALRRELLGELTRPLVEATEGDAGMADRARGFFETLRRGYARLGGAAEEGVMEVSLADGTAVPSGAEESAPAGMAGDEEAPGLAARVRAIFAALRARLSY